VLPATATPSISEDVIPGLRAEIDEIDREIARLVHKRKKKSGEIQAARMSNGGTRVELGRERVIHDNYRGLLGPEGVALADVILNLCRGTRPQGRSDPS